MNKKTNIILSCKYLALLLIPLIVLTLTLIQKKNLKPYYFEPDATYCYLFSSLHIVNGISPSFTDHPGTPMQLFGAGVLKLVHPTLDKKDIARSVFEDPEHYIAMINTFAVFVFVVSLIWIGVYAYIKGRDFWLAVFLQGMPSLYYFKDVYDLSYMNSDMMLYIVLNFYALMVLKLFYDKHDKDFLFSSILFGFVCGWGIVTRMNMLPLIMLPFVLIPHWKNRIVYLVSLVVSFIFWIIPMLSEYKRTFRWFYNMITHTGHYGEGQSGFIDTEQFSHNIKELFSFSNDLTLWLIFALIVTLIAFVMKALKKMKNPDWKKSLLFFSVLFCTIILQMMAVAKHFNAHYLIPAYGLIGIMLFFAFMQFNSSKIRLATILMLVLFLFPHKSSAHFNNVNLKTNVKQIYADFDDKIKNQYKGCRIMYSFGARNKVFGLAYGDEHANYMKFGDILNEQYPNLLFYRIENSTIYDWQNSGRENIVLKEKTNCIILYGSCYAEREFKTDFDLNRLTKFDGYTCVYSINDVKKK
jgi:hypothetical protein